MTVKQTTRIVIQSKSSKLVTLPTKFAEKGDRLVMFNDDKNKKVVYVHESDVREYLNGKL